MLISTPIPPPTWQLSSNHERRVTYETERRRTIEEVGKVVGDDVRAQGEDGSDKSKGLHGGAVVMGRNVGRLLLLLERLGVGCRKMKWAYGLDRRYL